ncbi:nicotinate-nucleotide--dimethylbenzimidazole phosphoribosyltransferase [Methylovirgula sp. 4M-Z18]|uniref:nicotinate-nucleotide--dimethylbenzimidazole phosphoribosyltransferase n=1 Tax=Methylovirgula sp. 4M-Z18 TaxID=2293567 RepID=UPI000E2F7BB8|nr:nicotinate-nucleotide--dimethylbenzimidazole phosphoribosyltransferase [Methylovirgula sp. 4M-Z18]RFB80583.1 nicotinate-nucleotide--dimethylbenzimidazole phosphoribosyltransferase [Methylovirgula sp. 4M-Z18]
MTASGLPFDDIRNLVRLLPDANEHAWDEVKATMARLDPAGALGRFHDHVAWLASWQGKTKPVVLRPLLAIFASSHGVSPVPPARTKQALTHLSDGGAAVNQICASFDAGLKVFDLAIDLPTKNIAHDAAMDEKTCAATMAFGMEAIAGGADLLCLSALGRGADLPAAAILSALSGGDWLPAASDSERETVAVALDMHQAHLSDPLEVLRRLGGRDIAALAGAILAARMERIPVVLDGLAAVAAAVILNRLEPGAVAHCLLGQALAESLQGPICDELGYKPVADFGVHESDGAGGVLAMGIIKTAVACYMGMVPAAELVLN